MSDQVLHSPFDRRKNKTERRAPERRREWEKIKSLGSGSEYWIGNRRKFGQDRRKQADKRVEDRRKGLPDRRYYKPAKILYDTRYMPEDLREVQAVSGGADRKLKPSVSASGGPIDLTKKPVSQPSSFRSSSSDSSSKPEESWFRATLREVGESLRSLWPG